MRIMYDTVDPAAVPETGWDLLAGYVDGALITPSHPGLRARFPDATIVSIDTQNRPGVAQMLDIEAGDATPAEAPSWFDASLARGIERPTLYFPASSWPDVSSHMGRRRFDYLVAAYSVDRCPLPGAVGWQKANHGPNGENVDVSEIYDDTWPGMPAPGPGPGPAPRPPTGDDDMVCIFSHQGGAFIGVIGAWYKHIPTPGVYDMLVRHGTPVNATDGTEEIQQDVFDSMVDLGTLATK